MITGDPPSAVTTDPSSEKDAVPTAEPKPEVPSGQKEGWWTDARKTLLTQVLTLLLTPASVAVTLYLTEAYKAPQPHTEYVSATPSYFVAVPSDAVRDQINSEPPLATRLRQEVAQRSPSRNCAAWLDGDSWESDCQIIYKAVASEAERELLRMIQKLKGGAAAAPYSPQALIIPDITEAQRALKAAVDLRQDLVRVAATPQTRAGDAVITVGIMNRGASDGTVFKTARLKFQHGDFDVYADSYTAVKAHAFVEVKFTTPYEKEGQFYGTRTDGQEAVVKAWSDLVRGGREIPFTVIVILSDKKASIRGALPKE